MARTSGVNVKVNAKIRALKIYPTEDSKRDLKTLDTIAFKLTKGRAVRLALVLLTMAQDHKEVDVTRFRSRPRKSDDSYSITVSSAE